MSKALTVDSRLDIRLVHDGVQALFPDVRVMYEQEAMGANHNFWLNDHEGIVRTEKNNVFTEVVSDVVNLIFNQDFMSPANEGKFDDAFIITKFDKQGQASGSFAIPLPATLEEVVNAVFVLLRAKFTDDYIL